MNEIDKFFGELPKGDGEFTETPNPEPQRLAPEKGEGIPDGEPEGGEGGSEGHKNRRHRRLEDQLRRERESNIALNERIRVLAEIKTQGGTPVSGEVPPEWIALYGDTPEAKTAWTLQERMFTAAKEAAKKEAIAEFQEQQQAMIQQQQEFETFIDSELEALEDEHNIDLTSDTPTARKARREFLEMVQKVSPKDEAGNVTSYADFSSTFELFKAQKDATKPTSTRQKEIASKTMQQSGAAGNSNASQDAELAWLRSQGIRV